MDHDQYNRTNQKKRVALVFVVILPALFRPPLSNILWARITGYLVRLRLDLQWPGDELSCMSILTGLEGSRTPVTRGVDIDGLDVMEVRSGDAFGKRIPITS